MFTASGWHLDVFDCYAGLLAEKTGQPVESLVDERSLIPAPDFERRHYHFEAARGDA